MRSGWRCCVDLNVHGWIARRRLCLLSKDLATAVVLEVLTAAKTDIGRDAGIEHNGDIDGVWMLSDELRATLGLRGLLELA